MSKDVGYDDKEFQRLAGKYDIHDTSCRFDPPKLKETVNHPAHYAGKIECIEIVEHMTFNRGNAIKYLWRAGKKGDEIEDLKKAAWYIEREIKRLNAIKSDQQSRLPERL